MTKHEHMQKARLALMGQEEALVDLLTEHEAANQEKRLQPSIIAQQLDLLLPEKGETYESTFAHPDWLNELPKSGNQPNGMPEHCPESRVRENTKNECPFIHYKNRHDS